MKIKRYYHINFFRTAILMLSMIACGGPKDVNQDSSDSGTRKVKTAFSKLQNVEQDLDFTGNVEPFEQYTISPALQLRIKKIYVDVGDRVKKGQLLVQMDPSQLIQTKAQLNNLEKEYARLDTLFRTGSVSEQQLEQIKTELDVLRANYQNLQENTRLVAPGNGIVTARNFEDGDMYNMALGKGILTVMQINPVQVNLNIPERYYPSVHKGMPVSLRLDVYPDTIFRGTVHLKYPALNSGSRTFTVETLFPNRQELIRPGMFGRINIVFETLERVTVPDLAVQKQQGTDDYFVFVVNNGRVNRKEVKIGKHVGEYFEVIQGLDVGEEVVVEGLAGLLDGAKVDVIE